MIDSEAQHRLTKEYLRKFDQALANLTTSASATPTRLQRLEIDAVSALAEDLRAEIREYEEMLSRADI